MSGVFAGYSAADFVGSPSDVAMLGYALWGNESLLIPAELRDLMVPHKTFYGLASQNVGVMGIAGGDDEYSVAYGHLGVKWIRFHFRIQSDPLTWVLLSQPTLRRQHKRSQVQHSVLFTIVFEISVKRRTAGLHCHGGVTWWASCSCYVAFSFFSPRSFKIINNHLLRCCRFSSLPFRDDNKGDEEDTASGSLKRILPLC